MIADVEAGVEALGRALSEDGKLRTVPAIALTGPGGARDRYVDSVTVDGAAPEHTVATVAELVGTGASSIGPPASGARPPTLRPASVPPMDNPARRELEAGCHDLRVLLGARGYGSNLRDGAGGALSEGAARPGPQDDRGGHGRWGHPRTNDSRKPIRGARRADRHPAGRCARTWTSRRSPRRSCECSASRPAATHRFRARRVGAHPPLGQRGPAEAGRGQPGRQCAQVRPPWRASPRGDACRRAGPRRNRCERYRAGCSAERSRAVFDHRVRLERDEGVGGTGMGLAVVRELVVVHHGGTVRVDDGPEGGAEFVVSLPLDRRARSRESSPVGRGAASDARELASGTPNEEGSARPPRRRQPRGPRGSRCSAESPRVQDDARPQRRARARMPGPGCPEHRRARRDDARDERLPDLPRNQAPRPRPSGHHVDGEERSRRPVLGISVGCRRVSQQADRSGGSSWRASRRSLASDDDHRRRARLPSA